jgi:hypothetical protein
MSRKALPGEILLQSRSTVIGWKSGRSAMRNEPAFQHNALAGWLRWSRGQRGCHPLGGRGMQRERAQRLLPCQACCFRTCRKAAAVKQHTACHPQEINHTLYAQSKWPTNPSASRELGFDPPATSGALPMLLVRTTAGSCGSILISLGLERF